MFLGVDVGGTTISLGLVRGTSITNKDTIPSFREEASLPETLEYLSSAIERILTPEIDRIGIGVPTVVDQEKGILYDAANIPSWKEVHLKEYLEGRFPGIEVNVNNDANCFALGAAAINGYPSNIIAAVTLGTGTGLGLVSGRKLISGENAGLGEIAMLPYMGKTYEDYCSKKFFSSRGLCPKDVYDSAKAGDKAALGVMEEFGEHLGRFLSVVMMAYDPGCIILGGGIANSMDLFEVPMWRVLREEFPYRHSVEKLKITVSSDPDAALIGASLL